MLSTYSSTHHYRLTSPTFLPSEARLPPYYEDHTRLTPTTVARKTSKSHFFWLKYLPFSQKKGKILLFWSKRWKNCTFLPTKKSQNLCKCQFLKFENRSKIDRLTAKKRHLKFRHIKFRHMVSFVWWFCKCQFLKFENRSKIERFEAKMNLVQPKAAQVLLQH